MDQFTPYGGEGGAVSEGAALREEWINIQVEPVFIAPPSEETDISFWECFTIIYLHFAHKLLISKTTQSRPSGPPHTYF